MTDATRRTGVSGSAAGGVPVSSLLGSAAPLTLSPATALPDWLRSLTVARFAPYLPATVPLLAGVPAQIVTPDPMRVGLILSVPLSPGVVVSITTQDAPDGHVIWSISGGDTRTAMLADYFSVVMAGLIAVSNVDTVLSVVTVSRPY